MTSFKLVEHLKTVVHKGDPEALIVSCQFSRVCRFREDTLCSWLIRIPYETCPGSSLVLVVWALHFCYLQSPSRVDAWKGLLCACGCMYEGSFTHSEILYMCKAPFTCSRKFGLSRHDLGTPPLIHHMQGEKQWPKFKLSTFSLSDFITLTMEPLTGWHHSNREKSERGKAPETTICQQNISEQCWNQGLSKDYFCTHEKMLFAFLNVCRWTFSTALLFS